MRHDVVDSYNKKVGEVELLPSVFEVEVKPHLIHDVVVWQMAKRRAGTHKTKERDEVRGGGQKPWKQKGLGRARAGSIRSPLFRGGGIVFGPRPRDYGYNVPKKARKSALASALTAKLKENALTVVSELKLDEPKTKKAVTAIASLGVAGKALVVTEGRDSNMELAFRNLPNVKLLQADSINVYDLLSADSVVFTQDAIGKVQEKLGK